MTSQTTTNAKRFCKECFKEIPAKGPGFCRECYDDDYAYEVARLSAELSETHKQRRAQGLPYDPSLIRGA